MTSGKKTVVWENTLHYLVSIRRHHTSSCVITDCHITIPNYLKAVVLSLVELKYCGKAANFWRIIPYSSDTVQCSETCLKGSLGRKRKLSLSEKSYSAEDKIFKCPYYKEPTRNGGGGKVLFFSVIGRYYYINKMYNRPRARHECVWGVKV